MTDDEVNDGAVDQACGSVDVHRCNQHEVGTIGLFTAAVDLAYYTDDDDDGALLLLPCIGMHSIAYGTHKLPAFDETDFIVAYVGETVLDIGRDGDVTSRLTRECGIDDLQRAAVTRRRCADGERAHPGRAACGESILAHATSFA